MKIFVYFALFFGSLAQAAISPADKILKNVSSNGKETVGQYLQRNKDIIPKALLEKWTVDPATKNMPMLPIEVSNTQGKLIFYLKDSSKKQHTMIWRAEKNNLFTFDGTPIPAVQFLEQESFIRNISGRDYRIRKMFERKDPQMWSTAFRQVILPPMSILKTQNKEKFAVYHRATVLFWLQARQVNKHKKAVAAQFEAKTFADFISSALIESAVAADAKRCVERGYVGYDNGSGCVIRGDEACGNKRSCNPTVYGRTDKGLIKCGAAVGGDDECGVSLAGNSPLQTMDERIFLQPNLASGMKNALSTADKIEAEKFARSFLKTSGDLKFTELDAAYAAFKADIGDAYDVCKSEFEKKETDTPDAGLRKKCLNLKKQEILFDAGLDLVRGDNKYVYTKDQAKTCDDSSLPTCDTPEAMGKTTCYKGTFSCHATSFAIGAGVAGVAATALMSNKDKKDNSVKPPDWIPFDPCNLDGAPTFMCSDPEKCKPPYDFSTVYNTCKPPVCTVGQVYSEIAKGCVDTCTNANQMMEKWKKQYPNGGGLIAGGTGGLAASTSPSPGTVSAIYVNPEPLNCFNPSCVAPKIWNPWSKKCEDAVDCSKTPTVGVGVAVVTTPMVRDQFNQCTYPQCGYGTERDWYTGECVAYSNWQTCPGTGMKVVNLERCTLIIPMSSTTSGSSTTDQGTR